MAGTEPTSQDFLITEVSESKTEQGIKDALLKELQRAEEIKAQFGNSQDIMEKYEDIRIATIGALRNLRVTTESDLAAVKKSLTGNVDFGALGENGDISRDEAEKIKQYNYELSESIENSISNDLRDKSVDELSQEEAKQLLRLSQTEYGEFDEIESNDLIGKGFSALGSFMSSDSYENIADRSALRSFQERLIEKAYGLKGPKFEENSEKEKVLNLNPESYNSQYVFGSGKDRGGNFVLSHEEIKNELKNNSPDTWNSLAVANYFSYLESKGELTLDTLINILGIVKVAELRSLWNETGGGLAYQVLRNSPKAGMVLRGFQELDIDRYMNSVNDFRKISPILETLTPEEQIKIRGKALAFLQRNPEKRNEIADIPLENGDTFFKEIVLESQFESYKNAFIGKISSLYKDVPEANEIIVAILESISFQGEDFNINNFSFDGINYYITEHNKIYNPSLPLFEDEFLENIKKIISLFSNKKNLIENLGNNYKKTKAELEQSFRSFDDIYKEFEIKIKKADETKIIAQTLNDDYDLTEKYYFDAFVKNPEKNVYYISSISEYEFLLQHAPESLKKLNFSQLPVKLYDVPKRENKNYTQQDDFYKIFSSFPGKIDTLSYPNVLIFESKNYANLEDYDALIHIILEKDGYFQIKNKLMTGKGEKENLEGLLASLKRLPDGEKKQKALADLEIYLSDENPVQASSIEEVTQRILSGEAEEKERAQVIRFFSKENIGENTVSRECLKKLISERKLGILDISINLLQDSEPYFDGKTTAQLFLSTSSDIDTTYRFLPTQAQNSESTLEYLFKLGKENPNFYETTNIFETLPVNSWEDISRIMDVMEKVYGKENPNIKFPINGIQKISAVLQTIDESKLREIVKKNTEFEKYKKIQKFLESQKKVKDDIHLFAETFQSKEEKEAYYGEIQTLLENEAYNLSAEKITEFMEILKNGALNVTDERINKFVNENIPFAKKEAFVESLQKILAEGNRKIIDHASQMEIDDKIFAQLPDSLKKFYERNKEGKGKWNIAKLANAYQNFLQEQHIHPENIPAGVEYFIESFGVDAILPPEQRKQLFQALTLELETRAANYYAHNYNTFGGNLDAFWNDFNQNFSSGTLQFDEKGNPLVSNPENNSEKITQTLGNYTISGKGNILTLNTGKAFISLTKTDLQYLNSPKAAENFVKMYDVFTDLKIEKIWDYKDYIFRALANRDGFKINLSEEYIDADELNIVLKSIISATTGEKMDNSVQNDLEVTKNKIISKVTNFTGNENNTGGLSDISANSIELSFIQKFTKYNSGDRGWFEYQKFYDALDTASKK